VAILDGDESLFLDFVQHFLFFGEMIVVIPVLKILEVKSLFCPETEVTLVQIRNLADVWIAALRVSFP
jgi:hypothetical protein